ncbi:MAG: nicotinate-nucleotide adenylyltransferase [Oscillospiraceae bacterium]|jgi:nicotinate-nucleotide adenylyltransferase|nr:nicotinate-nucleotide adenylyltransferase [Oscillospiraceae bacterium]
MRMKKLAILGGTFDPIHMGHIMLADNFKRMLHPDKMIIIPTSTPPHKVGKHSPEEIRFHMCEIANKDMGSPYEISDIEIKRKGKSYSYDTVVALRKMYPDYEIYMIVGSDMFITLQSWYKFNELKNSVVFCTSERDDDIKAGQLLSYAEKLDKIGCRSVVARFLPLEISSTMLRTAISRGDSIRGMVTPGVERYIYENNLYVNTSSGVSVI